MLRYYTFLNFVCQRRLLLFCFNGCIINSVNEMNKELTREMIKYLNGDVKRINHMLKVRAFSELIADGEKTDGKIKDILLSAAAVHDIGIHICEKKYGRHLSGKGGTE